LEPRKQASSTASSTQVLGYGSWNLKSMSSGSISSGTKRSSKSSSFSIHFSLASSSASLRSFSFLLFLAEPLKVLLPLG
jgi:hypothetical protein